MCLLHFNEPVICGLEIARLIGYGETAQDCYLICHYPHRIVWHTAVGGYTFLDRLKDQDKNGEWDDFTRLDAALHHSGVPREEHFLEDIRPDYDETRPRDLTT